MRTAQAKLGLAREQCERAPVKAMTLWSMMNICESASRAYGHTKGHRRHLSLAWQQRDAPDLELLPPRAPLACRRRVQGTSIQVDDVEQRAWTAGRTTSFYRSS
jgi:hypothetical protein